MIGICLSLLFIFLGESQPSQQLWPSKQLIVVKTRGWNQVTGTLQVYERSGNGWKAIFSEIPVVVGRSGLAWGKGLHANRWMTGKLKKEGDGNAPAGIFPLNGLFGYDDITAKMQSIKVNQQTFCVDDPSSPNYNRLVSTDTMTQNWNSAETMRLKTDGYKYGIVVGYNTHPAVPGKGSCIFMHIWKNNRQATAGCTAMTEENILRLIAFLDPGKQPLLVQLPDETYKKLRKEYGLP